MSAGDDGSTGAPPGMAGGGWGSFPQTTQQPAFAQAPANVQPAGGPFRAPDAPVGGGTVYEVDLPIQMRMPLRCACCGGTHQTNRTTQGAAKSGRTTERRRLLVPYCLRCAKHMEAGTRRGWAIGVLALVVGSLAPAILFAVWPYVPMAVFFAFGVVVALGACFAMERIWKEAPIAHEQGCTSAGRPAMWIRGFKFHAPTTQVQFTHRAFAEDIAAAHNVAPRVIGPRKQVSARWIAAPVLAGLASIPLFFGTHGHVYFDNPSTLPLHVDIDDGSGSLEVAAGQHETAYLPTGEAEFVVSSAGAVVDRFNGDVEGFTTHVASPFGSACYAAYDIAYGSASVAGRGLVLEPVGARWHTLSGVDYVLEPPPSTVEVGQGQTGTVKRRFVRVDCETHHVVR